MVPSSKLYAFNATTGAVLWATCTAAATATPAVVNGVAYISSNDGKLYTFKAATGTSLHCPDPQTH